MPKILMLCLLFVFSMPLQAATFCVGTSSELTDALETAESNGEDNTIKIKVGDYLAAPTVGTQFRYLAESNQNLTLSGGWSDFNQIGCLVQNDNPMDTVLDGGGVNRVLSISHQQSSPDVNVKIENLTISNGHSSGLSTPGMVLYFHPGHQGTVELDRLFFISNQTDTAAISALRIHDSYFTSISNSVFMYNHSKDGFGSVYMQQPQTAEGYYFVNNTLINNTNGQTAPNLYTSSGLMTHQTGGSTNTPQGLIANNLFWDNDHKDISATGGGIYYLYNNNYQSREGVFVDDVDNMSEAPLLAPQILNFTPQPGSPLIDRGKREPMPLRGFNFFLQGWTYGSRDFDGGLLGRVINNQVDIGAVEAPPEVPIFKDGFEG